MIRPKLCVFLFGEFWRLFKLVRHAAKFNKPDFDLFDYRVVALAGDGCLQDRPDVFFFWSFLILILLMHWWGWTLPEISYIIIWGRCFLLDFFPTVVQRNKSMFQREKVSIGQALHSWRCRRVGYSILTGSLFSAPSFWISFRPGTLNN